ncbi:MAG TPA: barstar family protein [Burkholderiales bacterium]|nr:barstar family protein [Burkholderiales bacterium]
MATRKARDKLAFLAAIAAPLDFPDRVGQNWDAVYDCFTALADRMAAGLVIVFDDLSGFARSEPDEFSAAVDMLRDAADAWAERGKRLIALMGLDNPLLAPDVPEISLSPTP